MFLYFVSYKVVLNHSAKHFHFCPSLFFSSSYPLCSLTLLQKNHCSMYISACHSWSKMGFHSASESSRLSWLKSLCSAAHRQYRSAFEPYQRLLRKEKNQKLSPCKPLDLSFLFTSGSCLLHTHTRTSVMVGFVILPYW